MTTAAGTGSLLSWRAVYEEAIGVLAAVTDSPAVDARRLVEEASGHEGPAFHAGLDHAVTRRSLAYFDAMLARRLAGEPLQYVLGRWSFRGLDLAVDARVLIPRPETEVVAGIAIEAARARTGARVVDLGTGSGAIALSVAAECPDATVWATDVSTDALAVARANLAGMGRAATRVTLHEGSWFDALPPRLRGTVDVVASNPPYVAAAETLPDVVAAWEPTGALVSGPTGYEAIEQIVSVAPRWLADGGVLVVEIGATQAVGARRLAVDAGLVSVEVVDDLAGHPRVLVARRSVGDG